MGLKCYCGVVFITYDTGLFTAMDIHLKNFPGLEDEWRGTEAHPRFSIIAGGPANRRQKVGGGCSRCENGLTKFICLLCPPPPGSVEEKAVYMDREIR